MPGAKPAAEAHKGKLHRIGAYEFDPAGQWLRRHGERTPLSADAAVLLEAVVSSRGRTAELGAAAANAGLGHDAAAAAVAELQLKLAEAFTYDENSGRLLVPLEFSVYAFIEELRSRKVFRVATGYVVTGWLLLQVAEIVFPLAGIDEKIMRGLLITILLGFPVAICAAWALELTPAGMIIDWRHNRPRRKVRLDERRIDRFIIASLVLVIAVLVLRMWHNATGENGVIRIVAVLPFTHIGAAGGDASLCEGFAEEIRVGLNRLPGVRVAARALSAETARGLDGIDWYVEGSCQVISDTVDIKVSLTSAVSGLQEWAYSDARSIEQLLRFQDDIAAALAFELVVPGEAIAAIRHVDLVNPRAYRLYLQGRGYLSRPNQFDTLATAAKLFQDAIDLDNEFAAAHAGLCEANLARYLGNHDPRMEQDAESACLRASQLGPGLAEVHVALGRLFLETGDHGAAENALRQALQIKPDSIAARVQLANVLAARDLPAQAEALFREALSVPSGSWMAHNSYGAFLLRRGQLAAAAEQFEEVVALTPDSAPAHNNLGAAYLQMGRLEDAAHNFQRAAELAPVPSSISNFGTMLYYTGKFADAEAQFRRAAELSPDDYRMRGNIADAVYQINDRRDEALQIYREAIIIAERRLEISRRDFQAQAVVAFYRSRLGDATTARELLALALQNGPRDPEVKFYAALIELESGDEDSAVAMLQAAVALGFPRFLLQASPDFQQLRDHTAFSALINS